MKIFQKRLYSRVRLGDDVLGDGAEVPGLADVLGAVHEEMLDDHEQHLDVVLGQVVLALLLVALEAGAVVGGEEGHDVSSALLDEEAEAVHLIDTLLAVEGRAKAGDREEEDELQHVGGDGGESRGDTEHSPPPAPLYRASYQVTVRSIDIVL